jgi:hypothetical protein
LTTVEGSGRAARFGYQTTNHAAAATPMPSTNRRASRAAMICPARYSSGSKTSSAIGSTGMPRHVKMAVSGTSAAMASAAATPAALSSTLRSVPLAAPSSVSAARCISAIARPSSTAPTPTTSSSAAVR